MDNFDEAPDTQPLPITRARRVLDITLDELEIGEIHVLTRIAQRLHHGMHAYGPFEIDTDTRDFRGKEAREELEDALVYLACAWLKAEGGAS